MLMLTINLPQRTVEPRTSIYQMSRAEERTSSEPRRQDGGYGGERASRSFYSPRSAAHHSPAETETGRDRCRPLRSLLLCCVGHRAARSLASQCSPSWKSKSPSPPSLPPSCNRRHRRDGVIFRRARTHSLTFSARSLGRSIGRSHFGSIAAPPCLRITRVRVSQLPRRKTSSVYIAGSRICDLRCADETRTAWTQSVSLHRWISWICVCISLPLRAQTEDMRLQKGKNDLIHFPRYFPQYGSLSTPNLNIIVLL